LAQRDFVFKTERRSNRQSERQYLNKQVEKAFTEWLDALFHSTVEIPRVKIGKRQEVETLISEEAMLLAKFLRGEKTRWEPRIAELRGTSLR
jgi:CRISPR/Cas system-associated endonuclease Cas1